MLKRCRLAAVFSALVLLVAFQYRSLDGLDGVVFGMLLTEDTKYATNFTDEAFRKIRKGMTAEAGHNDLGSAP
jgi:hypothetical protein